MTNTFKKVSSDRVSLIDQASKDAMRSENANRIATLSYLGTMLTEFRSMARGLEEQQLTYLLELAMMEANLQLDIARYSDDLGD